LEPVASVFASRVPVAPEFVPALPFRSHYSLTPKFGACYLLNLEMNVQLRYRLYRPSNGGFYWQDNESPRQGSLRTKDRNEAKCLLHAMNEARRQPVLNLALARTYLSAHDPKIATRSWQVVMDERPPTALKRPGNAVPAPCAARLMTRFATSRWSKPPARIC